MRIEPYSSTRGKNLIFFVPVGKETYSAMKPRDPKVICTHFFFFSSLWTVELSISMRVSR